MDINKILSEQLNLNALNPFATTNVEGVNDNAENSEMSVNPDVAEVSDALKSKDEDATLSFDSIDLAKLNKANTNINSMMNFMSNQVQNQENKEKQIEEEIVKKQEEYQKLAEDIQEKQEEYESLVKQAESEQDQTIAEQATALGEEINSMVSNLESIKTSIANLETNLKTQQNLTSTLKQTSQTMSKVQTQISKEVAQANAISQAQATNQVSETDAVGKVSQTQETQPTQPVSQRKQVEIKSMEEYTKELDCKFDELWDRFGNKDEINQYVKNNLIKFADITGDGRIDKIDLLIIQNYAKSKSYLGNKDEKGIEHAQAVRYFPDTILKSMSQVVRSNKLTYNLEDLENYKALGGHPNGLLGTRGSDLDFAAIVCEENWECRFDALFPQYADSYEKYQKYSYCLHGAELAQRSPKVKLKMVEEFIKNNPENAGYANIAVEFNTSKAYGERYKELMGCYPEGDYPFNIDTGGRYFNYADINLDGKIDVNDYLMLSTDIDLDGDGSVSSEEKNALSKLKKYMPPKLTNNTIWISSKNGMNIDEIIDYAENINYSDYVKKCVDTEVADMEYVVANSFWTENGAKTDYSNISPQLWIDRSVYTGAQLHIHTLMDGTKTEYGPLTSHPASEWGFPSYGGPMVRVKGDLEIGDSLYSGIDYDVLNNETIPHMQNHLDIISPFNTYKHYIMSADLSKEELECILNKIKNANSMAQSQLCEVVKVIEQKLAGM